MTNSKEANVTHVQDVYMRLGVEAEAEVREKGESRGRVCWAL